MFTHAQAAATATLPLFPLFADLRGRAVLVIGGGGVARRKVKALLEAGADVTVGATLLDPSWQCATAGNGRVRLLQGAFEPKWLKGAWLVVAASNDRAVNRAVAKAAQARQVLVNVVDDAELSSFHVPARVRRGRLQVAISTRGAAPVLARRLRAELEAELDDSLSILTELLARERVRIRRRFPQPGKRRRFYEKLMDDELPRLLQAGGARTAAATFEQSLRSDAIESQPGSVTLVGAGPGDPGLLTLRALRALHAADIILHDRLVAPEVLELARRDAERVDVGKRVGEDHTATQARIHALFLQHARAGHRVVRLQGGDPLVFGRGGEELDFLRAHSISHTIIPGITAALACAAAAGVPLTDRRHARSVTLLAARGAGWIDRTALSAAQQTLAIYMGVGELEALSHTLIRHARPADTPCVLIENGSLPSQRVLTGTLAEIPGLARHHAVRAPALLIVGEVAARACRAIRAERCCDAPAVATHAA